MNTASYLYCSLPHGFPQLTPQRSSHTLAHGRLTFVHPFVYGYLIDALEDVLHGVPRFFFLGNPSSDVAVLESLDERLYCLIPSQRSGIMSGGVINTF